MPPAVTMRPSPAITSVPAPTIIGVDAAHDVGIAGLADSGDATVANADVGFDDARMVDDHGVGDDAVEHTVGKDGGGDWPMPSRKTLPPPNLASSP